MQWLSYNFLNDKPKNKRHKIFVEIGYPPQKHTTYNQQNDSFTTICSAKMIVSMVKMIVFGSFCCFQTVIFLKKSI